ncbi:MAG: hypothetical protein NC453_00100, partial [Muribaculum sp.]|nr:hypothetical protein [Muribaculum sp.]
EEFGRVISMISEKGVVDILPDIRTNHVGWKKMTDEMESGMTFCNGRVGIAVSRRDLPRQDFCVNF